MGQGRSINDEYWQKNSPDTDICINQYLQFTQHPYTGYYLNPNKYSW